MTASPIQTTRLTWGERCPNRDTVGCRGRIVLKDSDGGYELFGCHLCSHERPWARRPDLTAEDATLKRAALAETRGQGRGPKVKPFEATALARRLDEAQRLVDEEGLSPLDALERVRSGSNTDVVKLGRLLGINRVSEAARRRSERQRATFEPALLADLRAALEARARWSDADAGLRYGKHPGHIRRVRLEAGYTAEQGTGRLARAAPKEEGER